MFNPRFPHKLRAFRVKEDENGNPMTNDIGDPIYEPILFEACEMYDHEPRLDSNGAFITYWVDEMSFGYRTASENSRLMGDVAVADYRLACPMFLTYLKYGDILELTDYTRTYKVMVVKQTTFNLGTNVWVNEIKN